MHISYLLTVLRARWVSAAIAGVLVGAGVMGLLMSQPKRYAATASILIDVKSPDPVAGVVLQGMTSPSYMLTQVDVIQSVRVATGAARLLRLDDDPKMQAAWLHATGGRGNRDAWVAEQLSSGLEARPSRGSNVINVSYMADTPELAAAAANAFAQSYLDTSIELRTEPAKQYNRFFDTQAKQLRDKLEAAQAALSAYQNTHGIVAGDERLDFEMSRLTELTSQLVSLEGQVAESGSRSGQARLNGDRVAEVANNPAVASLRADLSRQEGRLEELTARLGDEHPQVKELRASISDLRARLATETQRASRSLASTYAVDQSRLAQLRASLDQQRVKVLQLKSSRDQASVLLQDVANAQRSYDAVLARLNQTSLESQTVQANMSVLERATEPSSASGLRLRKILLIGGLAGLVAAAAVVGFREMRDRRLRNLGELMALTHQLPVVVIPAFRKDTRAMTFSRKRRALGQQPSVGYTAKA